MLIMIMSSVCPAVKPFLVLASRKKTLTGGPCKGKTPRFGTGKGEQGYDCQCSVSQNDWSYFEQENTEATETKTLFSPFPPV